MRVLSWVDRARIAALCTVALGTLLAALPAAYAEEYITGFEDLFGWFSGEPLAGQDGYYIPVAGSAEFFVYTYADNMLGLPQNPTGELQFIGGTGPGSSVYARAQRDLMFDEGNIWYLGYDFAAAYPGPAPGGNNLGSFSLRDDNATPVVTDYIHLMSWVDLANPTTYNAFYMGYDPAGTQFPQPGVSPGTAWENLQLDHWYRAWLRLDFDTNLIIQVGIIDLSTGAESTFEPFGWYLQGGTVPVGRPASFRFFAGGSVPDNVLAFDNIDIHPEIPTPVEESTWGAIKALYK
jgi:hypothetical protein